MVVLRSLLEILTLEREPDLSYQVFVLSSKCPADSLLSWLIVLADYIVGIHCRSLTPPLGLLGRLVTIVKVVFSKTESLRAEGDDTEDEYDEDKDNEEDNEDYGEGVEMFAS